MLFASNDWTDIIDAIWKGLFTAIGMYLTWKATQIRATTKAVATATGADDDKKPTNSEQLSAIQKKQDEVKVELAAQTEKSEERSAILKDIHKKVNGPMQAALRKVYDKAATIYRLQATLEHKKEMEDAAKALQDSLDSM